MVDVRVRFSLDAFKMIYILSYSWHDSYSPIILDGPKVDDWDKYCRSFLDEAIDRALDSAEGWVGWPEIVESLSNILCDHGYTKLNPTEKIFFGSTIIRDKSDDNESEDRHLSSDSLQKISKHNLEFERNFYERPSMNKIEEAEF